MTRKVSILDVAQSDFRDMKSYVKLQFGEAVWSKQYQKFKDAIQSIGNNPDAGAHLEELKALGLNNFRQRLVEQVRIIYEFNDSEVLVHIFIHTRRDFRTHLEKRLLSLF